MTVPAFGLYADTAAQYARESNAEFFEVSARTGRGVDQIFKEAAKGAGTSGEDAEKEPKMPELPLKLLKEVEALQAYRKKLRCLMPEDSAFYGTAQRVYDSELLTRRLRRGRACRRVDARVLRASGCLDE